MGSRLFSICGKRQGNTEGPVPSLIPVGPPSLECTSQNRPFRIGLDQGGRNMSADGHRYKKGDRYHVTEGFTGHVLTMWKAPFTGGYEKVIPAGLKFVIALDPPDSASSVVADAEPFSEWEELLVEADDRAHPKYNGYYLSIPFENV